MSLTYDDARPVHHEIVAPLLTVKKLTATFNVCAHSGFTENPTPWKHVASLGHELGNHTLFHPCRQEPEEDYGWLAPHYDLCDYSAQRWVDEMRVANCLLNQIDSQSKRTFGNKRSGLLVLDPCDPAFESLAVASHPLQSRSPLPGPADRAIEFTNLRWTGSPDP